MSASPLGIRGRGEPGASFNPSDAGDPSAFNKKRGQELMRGLSSSAAGAPASIEAPRPAVSAAPAPERKEKGAEVRGLEARYDEIVDDRIGAQGRLNDAKLIKSAALARKGPFVLSAMAEPTSRFLALERRIEELVGLDNTELAKIANEPVPEAAAEAVTETGVDATPETEVVAAAKAEAEIPAATSNLEMLGWMVLPTGDEDRDKRHLKNIVLDALRSPKTDWTKVDEHFLNQVMDVLEELKADKNKPAPEYPFLKTNRINKAMEQVQERVKVRVRINKAVGVTPEPAIRSMSPDEQVAQMRQQHATQESKLSDLHNQLKDYIDVAGRPGKPESAAAKLVSALGRFGRSFKKPARELKSQISALESAQVNLEEVIKETSGSSAARGIAGSAGDRARAQAERAGKGPYTV